MYTSVLKEPRNFLDMIHMCTAFNQLKGLIKPLSDAYLQNIAIHVCQIRHKNVLCTPTARETMHDGKNPNVIIIYIPPDLKQGAQIIINQAKNYLPSQQDNQNADDDFIFTCPGCGVEFSDQ